MVVVSFMNINSDEATKSVQEFVVILGTVSKKVLAGAALVS